MDGVIRAHMFQMVLPVIFRQYLREVNSTVNRHLEAAERRIGEASANVSSRGETTTNRRTTQEERLKAEII
ncbi:hypothetical protein EYF80_033583 [Liparis tanakae]|uniref:Uncharacterized protein n=1 Tax=Liparis tanakae TaxID=230148 RepID=A0A4Z2GRK8_9TELE|nr:hypothetical protein EYF80_033583 [Liparis tanakae]